MDELPLEEEFIRLQLVRTADAYDLLRDALEAFEPIAERQYLCGEQDIANAREELRTLREKAYCALVKAKRQRGREA